MKAHGKYSKKVACFDTSNLPWVLKYIHNLGNALHKFAEDEEVTCSVNYKKVIWINIVFLFIIGDGNFVLFKEFFRHTPSHEWWKISAQIT